MWCNWGCISLRRIAFRSVAINEFQSNFVLCLVNGECFFILFLLTTVLCYCISRRRRFPLCLPPCPVAAVTFSVLSVIFVSVTAGGSLFLSGCLGCLPRHVCYRFKVLIVGVKYFCVSSLFSSFPLIRPWFFAILPRHPCPFLFILICVCSYFCFCYFYLLLLFFI